MDGVTINDTDGGAGSGVDPGAGGGLPVIPVIPPYMLLPYTGYDSSMHAVRVITLVVTCVGVFCNLLMFLTASNPNKGSLKSGAGFIQAMAVMDTLTLVFTGLLSVGLGIMGSASLNASRGLCRMKGFTMFYTVMCMSLLLAIATEIRVLAVWVPSLHKKIGGSTKLAWFTVVKVLLMTSFICAPLIAIHEVTMGELIEWIRHSSFACLQIDTYMQVLLWVFILAVPLGLIVVGVLLLGVSLFKGHPSVHEQDGNGGLVAMNKSITVAHILMSVVPMVCLPLFFYFVGTAITTKVVWDKQLKWASYMLLCGEMVACIMASTKFPFYLVISSQFRSEFLKMFGDKNQNHNEKRELHETHEM